jgi:hypothetical protein
VKTPKFDEVFKEPKRKRRNSAEGNRPNLAKKRGTIEHMYARLTTAHQTLKTTRNFFITLWYLEVGEAPETGVTKKIQKYYKGLGRIDHLP